MENHSKRMAHGDPRPARTPSSREQGWSFFQGFLNEAVVQHVTYTSLILVELVEELYTLHGERPPEIFNFQARA